MSVCLFNSLSKGYYSNFIIVATFSNSPSSGKPPSPVKNSYLAPFPNDKAEITVVCRFKSY